MGSVRNDLKSLTVGGVTSEQVASAGTRVFLSNTPDLSEAGQMGRDIQSIRTFGPWLDPNGGAQSANTPATSATLRPAAGEQYVVYAVSALNETGGALSCILQLSDGASVSLVVASNCDGSGATTAILLPFPIVVTNSLYLVAQNSGTMSINFGYHQSVRA